GIGVVTLAACLGELGDPTRFESPRQMSRMAGYNLVEDSSGKKKESYDPEKVFGSVRREQLKTAA
ncbi:MAG: transposase, partial [Ruminococcus sp.]